MKEARDRRKVSAESVVVVRRWHGLLLCVRWVCRARVLAQYPGIVLEHKGVLMTAAVLVLRGCKLCTAE